MISNRTALGIAGLKIPKKQFAADTVSRDKLLELERFAAIGRVSAGLLHEINNPLTAAVLWLDQCGSHHSPHVRHARNSIDLLQKYVEAARQQVRKESHHENFKVQEELEQVRHILLPLARRRGISLHFGPSGGFMLHGDPVKFQQIIANLVRNAIDSYDNCPASGYKPVGVDLYSRRRYLIIEVSDHGCGIGPEQLKQLFEPFYTTKNGTGRGLGLGLSSVKLCIETDFKGSIAVRSSKRRGTRFIVSIKLAKSP